MKTVFLTGGSGDIGQQIKNIFAKHNYDVIAPTKAELNLEDIEYINEYFEKKQIQADIIIHCAGMNIPKQIQSIDIQDIIHVQYINWISFFEIVKYTLPYMQKNKYGKILAISSLYSMIARRDRLAYASSKHALNGLIKTLACELGKDNILANAISPGFINTQLTRKNNTADQIAGMENTIPLRRLGTPDEVAELSYFLCAESNTYITGQNIVIDGGFMANGGQNL